MLLIRLTAQRYVAPQTNLNKPRDGLVHWAEVFPVNSSLLRVVVICASILILASVVLQEHPEVLMTIIQSLDGSGRSIRLCIYTKQ